jgi:hypothetical protein
MVGVELLTERDRKKRKGEMEIFIGDGRLETGRTEGLGNRRWETGRREERWFKRVFYSEGINRKEGVGAKGEG